MAGSTVWIEQQKALWMRAYDEVIAPELENQWKKRDQDHKNQLKEKEENQQILFNHLNEEIQKTARLTKENESLKEELRRRYEPAGNMSGPGAANSDSSLQEEFLQLTEKFSELTRKYEDVTQKAKYLERKNQAVMQKNKDMKESVRAWQEYADRQAGKQKLKTEVRTGEPHSRFLSAYHHEDRPHVPSSPCSVATARTPATPADFGRSSPAPIVSFPQASVPTPGASTSRPTTPRSHAGKELQGRSGSITPKPAYQSDSMRQNRSVDRVSAPSRQDNVACHEGKAYASQQANPDSSQTTVDEFVERVIMSKQDNEVQDEDDFPQFVSERSLKRKRGQPPKSRFQIYADRASDGTPAKPYSVKEEPQSSPPTTVSTVLLRKETFDLDEPAPIVLTSPRHTRKLVNSHSNATGTLRHQRSNSAPFSQSIKEEHQDIDQPRGNDSHDPLVSHRATVELPLADPEERACSEPTDSIQLEENVLRSLDPNITSNISEEPPKKRSRRSGARHLAGLDVLAESGESSGHIANQLRLPPRLARERINRRLRSAKSPQTPIKSSLQAPNSEPKKIKAEPISTPSPDTPRSKHTPHKTGHESSSKPLDNPTHSGGQIWTMKAPNTRAGLRKSRGKESKQQGRLRDRPHTELAIQDFKPNPAYNQGYSYAFSETVRKRGDRMCLPGCTNLQCCGSTFRAFAQAQAPLPASEEEALVEDYLGDAYNSMQLTQMSVEERQELVLQARTRKLAKESGKHRQAYERRRTPPGFWRVDFPTTQEQQEDREKAREMERMEVQQRWLEAQRKGGKWVFRDE